MAKKDEQRRLHNILLTELNNNLDPDSEQYHAFRLHIRKPLGGAGVLGRCKSLFDIFTKLEQRSKLGVLKYDVLKEAFRGSDNDDLVELIEEKETEIRNVIGDDENAGSARKEESSLAPKRKADEEVPCTSKEKRKPEERDDDPSDGKFMTKNNLDYYETSGKTGFLIILNFTQKRPALQKDVTRLTGFFEDILNFDVMVTPRAGSSGAGTSNHPEPMDAEVPDLTSGQVTATLTAVRDYLKRNAEKYYCFMCVILSHGEEGSFETKDGGLYRVDDIRKIFSNHTDDMPEFAGKPKIFVVQACQGNEEQPTTEIEDEADDENHQQYGRQNGRQNKPIDEADQRVHIPKDADVLFIYATTPGYSLDASVTLKGTYLIYHMVGVFRQWYEHLHLEDMLISVRHRTSQQQTLLPSMPYTWSTLTHRLQFVRAALKNWPPTDSALRETRNHTHLNDCVSIDSVLL